MSRYGITNFDRGFDLGKTIAEGNAQAEIDELRIELRTENTKLREENAHLQSLVKQFYWYTKSMHEALRKCKDKDPYYLEVLDDSLAKVYDQMVELGIEVDG